MAEAAHRFLASTGGLRRRVTAVVAVYALVLQAFAFALAGGQIGAGTPADGALGFEICLHDDGAPATPAPASGDHVHCVFCVAGAHHAFVPPVLAPLGTMVAATGTALPPARDWRRPARNHPHSAQPRGPPLTA